MRRTLSPTRFLLLPLLMLLVLSSSVIPISRFNPVAAADPIKQLRTDAGGRIQLTRAAGDKAASFIRARIPVPSIKSGGHTANFAALGNRLQERYGGVLGVNPQAGDHLEPVEASKDELGMRLRYRQRHQGIVVHNAYLTVVLDKDATAITAISNGTVTGLGDVATHPRLTAHQASAIARRALKQGVQEQKPSLVLYPITPAAHQPAESVLAWLVRLYDARGPVRNLYVVNALDGTIVAVEDLLVHARDRATFSANNGSKLPGTLRRSEADPPTGDVDVDRAHDFAGTTYDYYHSKFGRDSYDGHGARLNSSVHFSKNYRNAMWDGQQMVYGDGYAVLDVAAHELTHAVTEHTAGLEYKKESGALNESFSDIFAAMVDRDDWLIGEDLPREALGGNNAIRDMADPSRLGQPEHVSEWVATCDDNEGVHSNSGIINKAFHDIAVQIGMDPAEQIFYRALTTYLQAHSSFEDARSAAIQAATDLYGQDSQAVAGVTAGFNGVGLDGTWTPPSNSCGGCAIRAALTGPQTDDGEMSAVNALAVFYRVRDDLLPASTLGRDYATMFYANSKRITFLLLVSPSLRRDASRVLRTMAPGLEAVADRRGDEYVVSPALVRDSDRFLQQLGVMDRRFGGSRLAETIERERQALDLASFSGMTFKQAWQEATK